MKNFINYYYNFNIYDIYFKDGKYFFYNDKIRYMLKICENFNFDTYYPELKDQILKYRYFFEPIKNKDNSYITWIDGKPYLLMKLSNIQDSKISIFDIKTNMYINNTNSTINRFPWINLWENKIDYFEELFYNKQSEYKKILTLFNFYTGIAENALLYLKESEIDQIKETSDNLVISHDRLTIDYNLYDYYDPINIIIDHPSRDVSEYIKSMFINDVWNLDIVRGYLKKHYFSQYGLRVMYARTLFPSFFFDYIENMIEKKHDADLLYLEARTQEFKNFIHEISTFFFEEYNIPVIQWITKKI